jgi:transposase
VIEPTGHYSLGFVKHANNAGRSVLIAPPRKAKAFLASIQSRAKTDKIDSYGLALFAQSQPLRIYPIKSAVVEQLDQLLSARRGISQSIAALTQQSQTLPHAAEQLEASVSALKEQLKAIDKEIAKASATDATLQNTVHLLRKAHGIGPVTASALAACLTSKQFETPAQFVAYIGLDVGIVQSGKSRGQVGLTKQGNAELRRLLYLAAQATLRTKDSPFKEQYKHLREGGRKHKEAITIMSRKLAKLCWSIAKNQSEFDPDRIFTRPPRQDSDLEHNASNEALSEHASGPDQHSDLTQS